MASEETLHRSDAEYNPFEHRVVDKPNSTTGTLLHVIKGSLGTGIMAMPLAFKQGGLLFGTVGTVAICAIYAHCVHLLVSTSQKASKRKKVPLLGFSETAEAVFSNGPRGVRPLATLATRYVDVMILIQSFLSFCLYLVFIAKTLKDVLYNQQQMDWDTRIYILLVLIPAVVITQVRELKYLVPFSGFANAIMITAIGIVLYFVLSEPLEIEDRNMFPQWSTLPSFISTVLFAIQGIRYILPIENKMKHPEDFLARFGVINIAITFLTALYIVMGFFGYAQYGERTQGSVTLNLPSENALAESTRLLAAIAVLLTLGLSYYVPMEIMWHKLGELVQVKYHNWAQIGMRFAVLIVLAAVAIGAPEIEPFVGLVGSFGSGTLVVLYPVAMDVIFRWPNGFGWMKWHLVKNIVLFVFGLLVLIFGTYSSIKNIVDLYRTFGTLLHVIKGSLGTGIMAMPLAFKQGGLLFGAIGTVAICIIYAHCVHLLVSTSHQASKRSKIPSLGFSETAADVFTNGPPRLRPLATFATRYVDVMILIQSYLAFCMYLIFIARTLRDVVINQQQVELDTRIYLLLLLVPVAVITQIRELKYLVPFSGVANAIMIASIGITLYFILREPITLTDHALWGEWSSLPSFISTVIFAIQGIEFILPIENKMQHPHHFTSWCGINNVSIGFLTVLYSVTGFFGYAQFGDQTQGSVTLNLPNNNALAESTRLLSAIAILLSLGLSYYVPMEITWHMIADRLPPKFHNWAQAAIRFNVLLVLMAVAIVAPQIEPFVGLAGSIGGGTLVVIYPVMLDVVFRWSTGNFGLFRWHLVKNFVLFMFGLFVLIVGTYFSVMEIVDSYR
ncbi:proton-coupled amino acid transporter-like protein CG1139 [Culex quinquefasciatus]|uniref:proton-coupled amino acid transporter-like protein CG1139 n=1 Tax=Culex quinquefasciatus TaxID=7176 RepID=UPI0018E3D72F|nr:proton-coupled amino acid transporter-like protein CG1139 [Culex quinquefasciatus]